MTTLIIILSDSLVTNLPKVTQLLRDRSKIKSHTAWCRVCAFWLLCYSTSCTLKLSAFQNYSSQIESCRKPSPPLSDWEVLKKKKAFLHFSLSVSLSLSPLPRVTASQLFYSLFNRYTSSDLYVPDIMAITGDSEINTMSFLLSKDWTFFQDNLEKGTPCRWEFGAPATLV